MEKLQKNPLVLPFSCPSSSFSFSSCPFSFSCHHHCQKKMMKRRSCLKKRSWSPVKEEQQKNKLIACADTKGEQMDQEADMQDIHHISAAWI